MPSPSQVAALLKAQNIRHVRLYDADRAMLNALANTGIRVTVSVPNEQLLGIGQSNATAANWVARNVIAHVPATNITAIAVGSEILTTLPNAAPVLSTGSYFMLNVYPYYDYMQSNGVIPLDYALFRPLPPNKEAVDANTLLHYTNVFDAVVDAAYFSMSYLNFTKIPIFVTESGWPSKVYTLHLTGAGTLLANDTTNQTFCVAKEGADPKMLQAALDWACGPGKVDCSFLLQGQPCYEPDNVVAHSTYAFNAYFQKMAKSPGTCDFKGVATVTTSDPSHGSCIFPGSAGRNGTFPNTTSLAPSSNSSTSGCHSIYGAGSFTTSVIIGVLLMSMVCL
ncbi:hypothetical protein D5086_019849 [Populus alba]|uniref:Uncharacterized protein n=1 Tax=Populus alba TaxID=43335 RepID=A0ACC4BIB4_POPAL